MYLMKYYKKTILLGAILSILSGCYDKTIEDENKIYKKGMVKERMNTNVYVDPAIDLSSPKPISIIIEFKTSPAKTAMKEAEAKGNPLTMEEAIENVERSHTTFQKELHMSLDKNQVPYRIKHIYKDALNGVAMELPANEINRLMESTTVISRISLDRTIQLDPPINPY